jgi:hypothetical protein
MLDSSDLRKQARLARRLAEQTYSEAGREEFLSIAGQCEREADSLDSQELHLGSDEDQRRIGGSDRSTKHRTVIRGDNPFASFSR